MRHYLLLLIFAGLTCTGARAQGLFSISPGTTVYMTDTTHLWIARLDLQNDGALLTASGTVHYTGNGQDHIRGLTSTSFHNLLIEKSAAANLYLDRSAGIGNRLRFDGAQNLLVLDTATLTLGSAAAVTGFDADEYIVTGGTGRVLKQTLSTFTFPLGFNASTYNPLQVTQNGTADDIGARCLEHVLANGASGSALNTGVADVSWELTEAASGGSSLDLTAQWNGADELAGFNRISSGIARFNSGSDWDLPPANMAAAAGSDPYSRNRSALQPGVFAVSGELLLNKVLLSAKVFLQGPFDSTAVLMNDQLRSGTPVLIPSGTPATYGTGKFAWVGWQPPGGYTLNPSIFTVTGANAIVDWVFVYLKDPANPATIIQNRPALLQRDGDVVDLDGVSPLPVPGNTGNYIVAVGHRNHLSVRSPNGTGLALDEASPAVYDFTTAMSQAYGTNPMKKVKYSTPVFALWGGNANANTSVRATGPPALNDYTTILSTLGTPTTILTNIYSNSDLNMDRTVRATGPPTINDYTRLLNILGTPTNIINEQQ